MKIDSLFKKLYKLPRSGIYCLLHKRKKKIYITHSKNICTSLSKNIKDIQDNVHIYKQLRKDVKSLEFVILEVLDLDMSLTDIHNRIYNYINIYKQDGYTLYNEKVKLIKNKVTIQIVDYLVHVVVGNTRKSTLCGIFDNMEDAVKFKEVLENQEVILPIQATNSETLSYFRLQSL